jgi:hypothetical protein
MATSTTTVNDIVRRGLLKIDDATVIGTVDALNLKGNNKLQAVVGMPLRSLQQRHDVTSFAATAPMPAVKAILELLAMEPLEHVIEALGEHADAPSFEQLDAAITACLANGSSNDDIVAVLTFAIAEGFPAAPHCRRLLDERPEFALPELPDTTLSSTLLVPKQVDADVREQRRLRREEDKKKKQNTAQSRLVKAAKVKRVAKAAAQVNVQPPSAILLAETVRRSIKFTPGELAQFSPEHPLVGSVVLADVPFDAIDPQHPEQHSKERPVVIVAATDGAVLVQGVYSQQTTSRILFQPWRRLGLDHVSYVDSDRVGLLVAPGELQVLGKLTNDEWNTLL